MHVLQMTRNIKILEHKVIQLSSYWKRKQVCAMLTTKAQNKSKENPKPRKVVTSFIQNKNKEFLIVQRSESVSSYHWKWSAISGSVETNDKNFIKRALIEIEEEIGLSSPEDIKFIRYGRPLYIKDGIRVFLIYPFLFEIVVNDDTENFNKDGKIKLNWESVNYQWISKEKLREMMYECVPQLYETLERVDIDDGENEFLKKLEDDRSSGAMELSLDVCDYFINNKYDDKEKLKNMAYHISIVRPSMTAVADTAIQLIYNVENLCENQNEYCESMIEKCAKDMKMMLNEKANRICECFHDEILKEDMTILTLSYSSMVKQVLQTYKHASSLHVIICESR